MQTQTPRKLSANRHLPIKQFDERLKKATFRRNIAISTIAFLSLSSVLNANPNEINSQGGGGSKK